MLHDSGQYNFRGDGYKRQACICTQSTLVFKIFGGWKKVEYFLIIILMHCMFIDFIFIIFFFHWFDLFCIVKLWFGRSLWILSSASDRSTRHGAYNVYLSGRPSSVLHLRFSNLHVLIWWYSIDYKLTVLGNKIVCKGGGGVPFWRTKSSIGVSVYLSATLAIGKLCSHNIGDRLHKKCFCHQTPLFQAGRCHICLCVWSTSCLYLVLDFTKP